MAKNNPKKRVSKLKVNVPRCGLCSKKQNLINTDCCGNLICDDESNYKLFSYARNSCSRNHRRYTLCGYHHIEGHEGHWKDCDKCKNSFGTEMYVWYGTNEYNYEKLENPPSYEPTHCSKCGVIIRLAYDSHVLSGDEYWCEQCAEIEREKEFKKRGIKDIPL